MNIMFKIMFFTIALNFAFGIMNYILPELGSNPQYNAYINSSDMDAQAFQSGMNQSISPTTESGSFFRLLDNIVVGNIARMLNMVNNYMFGFNNFICNLFGLGTPIKLIINSILSICYTIGAFWLWTGKELLR